MPSVTMRREEAVQRWPVEKKAPLTAHSTATFEIGVVEHDQRILAAHLELELLHRSRRDAGRGDLAAGRDRAGEADGVDVRDARAAPAPTTEPRPITRLNTPVGRPARRDDLDERPGRARHEVGRLEHHGVAVAERRRDLPGRDRDREIPRRDQADDAERLARDLDVDAGAHGGELLAGQPQRFAGEELEDLAGARDLADALRQRLAFLARRAAGRARPCARGSRREAFFRMS